VGNVVHSGKPFASCCSGDGGQLSLRRVNGSFRVMSAQPANDVYTLREVARAIGVPETRVCELLARDGSPADFVTHAHAVRRGRALRGYGLEDSERAPKAGRCPERNGLFSLFTAASHGQQPTLPIAISGTLHAALIATFVVATSMGVSTGVTAVTTEIASENDPRLVFISTPGPGGGGGGRLEPAPVARALRSGHSTLSSPVPERQPPAPAPRPEPETLEVEPLPAVVSPLASLPAAPLDRKGSFENSPETSEGHGPSVGGGAGLGAGSGIGPGNGPGVGLGSGGGLGGGPFRPGSGVEPPRLLHEVKADYTEAARRAGVEGEVVLEVVVRQDGSVSDIKLLRRLGHGLDERAVAAVRDWRFAPATRAGTGVDVIVEIAIEFRLT